MASKAPEENNDEESQIASQKLENSKKVSELEIKVDGLTEENGKLFVALQNERRKLKHLQSELDLDNLQDSSKKQENSEDFLLNVISSLGEKVQLKENECEELEDRLAVLNQEMATRGEELSRARAEFEHQVVHLQDLLTQERELNNQLSEESDQTIRELETKVRKIDDANILLKSLHNESSERIQTLEKECYFYQKKLKDTEKRLLEITTKQLARKTKSVSCQIDELELHVFQRREHESLLLDKFYAIFRALWLRDNIDLSEVDNASKYEMEIFTLIRNGFRNLRGS